VVEQVELLEDEADPAGADRGEPGVGHPFDVLPADADPAAVRPLQGPGHVQQGALARSGGTEDRHPFGPVDLQGDPGQRGYRRRARIGLGQVGHP
jgi:hypothetical protein